MRRPPLGSRSPGAIVLPLCRLVTGFGESWSFRMILPRELVRGIVSKALSALQRQCWACQFHFVQGIDTRFISNTLDPISSILS